jgi:hypothetical protein
VIPAIGSQQSRNDFRRQGNRSQHGEGPGPTAQRAGLPVRELKGYSSYLTNNADHLHYDQALEKGWPIATGVIEGAARHLVADRFDLAGARWGLAGAEALLKLRALTANGDLDTYWRFHLDREHHRVHQARHQMSHQLPTETAWRTEAGSAAASSIAAARSPRVIWIPQNTLRSTARR